MIFAAEMTRKFRVFPFVNFIFNRGYKPVKFRRRCIGNITINIVIGLAIAKTDMNVRQSPSKDGRTLSILKKGYSAEILEITPLGWLKIAWSASANSEAYADSSIANFHIFFNSDKIPYHPNTDKSAVKNATVKGYRPVDRVCEKLTDISRGKTA
jgi:hypothetical protein